jgi:hypothetical protein
LRGCAERFGLAGTLALPGSADAWARRAYLADRSASGPYLGGRDLAHRQQAISRDTLVGHDAEQLAGGLVSVVREHLEVALGGEALAQLPQADGVDREAQVGGDLLQGDLVLPAPVLERNRKAGTDVALEFRVFGHGGEFRRGYGLRERANVDN